MENSKPTRVSFSSELYFYFRQGAKLFDKFKFPIAVSVGTYYLFDLKDPLSILLIFLAIVPIIAIAGALYVYKIKLEQQILANSTETDFDKQERYLLRTQIDILSEINGALKKPTFTPHCLQHGTCVPFDDIICHACLISGNYKEYGLQPTHKRVYHGNYSANKK